MKLNKKQFIKDVIEWDVLNWAKCLDFWTPYIETNNDLKVLTVGERNGGLSLWFAEKGLTVVATDKHGLTDIGKAIHRKYDLNAYINYDMCDITKLKYSDNSFDIVAFKSVLGGLKTYEKETQAVNEMYRILKPNGVLLFAEQVGGFFIHKYYRNKFNKFRWIYSDYHETKALFNDFNNRKFKSYGYFGAFVRNERLKKLPSNLDCFCDNIIPNSWKYIIFGVCKK